MQEVTAVIQLRTEAGLATVESIINQTRRIDAAIVMTEATVAESLMQRVHDAFLDADLEVEHIVTSFPLRPESAKQLPDNGWLWFVDDSVIADQHALEHLSRAVEISPSVTIAGCKQVQASDRRVLVDVGLTVDTTGEPLSMIEPEELDQGQYDSRADVFSVSAPGMLVRADVWADASGFDPYTPEFGRAVDLSWRTRLAGHRVIVVPEAIMAHVEQDEPSLKERSQTATWLYLKHRPALSLVPAWIWVLLTAIGTFLWSLIIKAPGTGVAKARGKLAAATRPVALQRARSQASDTRIRNYSVVDALRPEPADIKSYRRSVLQPVETDQVIGDGSGTSDVQTEPTGGHDDFTALATPERTWVGTGAVVLGLLLAGVAVIGLRFLLGAEATAGGNLVPASTELGKLVQAVVSGYQDVGPGFPGYAGPFGWILVLWGLTGNASVAITTLMVLAMPLAGLSAWIGLSAITRYRSARFGLALIWGVAPVLMISISDGRLGAVVVHLLLPLLMLAVTRAIGAAPKSRQDPAGQRIELDKPGTAGVVSWTASGWVAILLAMISAAAPALAPALVIGVVLVGVFTRGRGKPLYWTPLLTLALFLPQVITSWRNPRAILADPGQPAAYLPANTLEQFLGFPNSLQITSGLSSLPWLDQWAQLPWAAIAVAIVAAPLVLLALIGVFKRPVGLVIAAVGLVLGFLIPHLIFAIDTNGLPVAIFTGPAVSLTWLGLLISAAAGLNLLGKKHKIWSRLTVVASLITFTLVSTIWLIPRTVGAETLNNARTQAVSQRIDDDSLEPLMGFNTLRAAPQTQLPATAVDAAESGLATRTLVIERTTEGIRSTVVTGPGTQLEDLHGVYTSRTLTGSQLEPQVAPADAAGESIRTLAAELVSASATDPRAALNDLGVSFVVLVDSNAAETATAAQIDSMTGLASVGYTEQGWLWRVNPEETDGLPLLTEHGEQPARGLETAKARLLDEYLVADSKVEVPATDADTRTLKLAHRADAGFRAYFNGEELTGQADGWAQSFELPTQRGELEVDYEPAVHPLYWAIPGFILLVALLLGIPSPTRDIRATTPAAPEEDNAEKP